MMLQVQETKQLAEQLLAATFNSHVHLSEGTTLAERDHVFRFAVLEGPANAPTSVVVKRARTWGGIYDPDTNDPWNPAWSLLNDWAGLQFIGAVAGDLHLTPHFYAGNRQHGLIVVEDLGTSYRPDTALLGNNPADAASALVELATLMGTMHAHAIGQQELFEQICASIGRQPSHEQDQTHTLRESLVATLNVLTITPPVGLNSDLAWLTRALQQPSPFWAYTHGDPCPDNWLQVAGGLRLLDFERGGFRHALLDGVYGRILFPTCWCVNRLPVHVQDVMQAAYRAALAPGCPAALDDQLFGQAVVEACAYWAIDTCQWVIERPAWYAAPQPIKRDRQWGIATIQQRALVRADILARTTREYQHLEAIGTAFELIAAKLRSIWPAMADAMPYYPAFREALEE